MKLKAYGNNVIVKRIGNAVEQKAQSIGLHLSEDAKGTMRDGAKVRFIKGELVSIGSKASKHLGEPLVEGDFVLYNPFDGDPWEEDGVEYQIVNAAAVVAKLG